MGFGRNVVCVLFWYAIAGGIGALVYRLTMELARAWSPSRRQYAPFGKPAIQIVAVLEFIPLRLFALLLLAGHNMSAVLNELKQQAKSWPLPGPAWVLCTIGNKFQLSLEAQLYTKASEQNAPRLVDALCLLLFILHKSKFC